MNDEPKRACLARDRALNCAADFHSILLSLSPTLFKLDTVHRLEYQVATLKALNEELSAIAEKRTPTVEGICGGPDAERGPTHGPPEFDDDPNSFEARVHKRRP